MKTIVFFLEGPSEKEMLMGLLPRLLSHEFDIRYLVFRGKQDLEKNLVHRMRGWQIPNSIFVVKTSGKEVQKSRCARSSIPGIDEVDRKTLR